MPLDHRLKPEGKRLACVLLWKTTSVYLLVVIWTKRFFHHVVYETSGGSPSETPCARMLPGEAVVRVTSFRRP